MRLAVNLGYMGLSTSQDMLTLASEADRLGYDSAWVAEAYGSDTVTFLAWIGARTEQIVAVQQLGG